jgi:DNA polymerase-4
MTTSLFSNILGPVENDFPQAVLHVDGDAFFASCEIAQNEKLRGRPVVTGEDKGIATAVSYAAKALGVSRGMQIWQIRKLFPDVIITNSHYDIYRIYSLRMYNIVRRYTSFVEEYSVDECFADLSALCKFKNSTSNQFFSETEFLTNLAKNIKHDLEQDLGMTFSVGLAPTKTLAKVASKWKKPAGFTILPLSKISEFLHDVPVNKVWGIGPSMSNFLARQGIITALDFISKPHWWIKENLSKPQEEIWHELKGIPMHDVHVEARDAYKSVMKTRTFTPTQDKQYIFSELCRNVERACSRLRKYDLTTNYVYFYLKTQSFQYKGTEIKLDHKLQSPHGIIRALEKYFPSIYRPNVDYRASGVVFRGISPLSTAQHDLFGASQIIDTENDLYKVIDRITNKFGTKSVFLAGSLRARHFSRKDRYTRISKPQRSVESVEEEFLKLGIPSWGEVK